MAGRKGNNATSRLVEIVRKSLGAIWDGQFERVFVQEFLEWAIETTGSQFGSIVLLAEGLPHTVVFRRMGGDVKDRELSKAVEEYLKMDRQWEIGKQTDHAVVCNHVQSTEKLEGLIKTVPTVKRYMRVPLEHEGETIGWVELLDKESDYTRDNLEEVKALASLFVLLHNAHNDRAVLQESLDHYRSLFTNSLSGVALHKVILDKDGIPVDYKFIDVNHAFEHMTGLKGKEIEGLRVTEVIPTIAEDDFDWIGTYGRVALGGGPIRFERYFAPLGRWFSISAFSPREGYFVSSFMDVTEHRASLEALESSERRFRTMVSNIAGAVYRCRKDEDWTMTFISETIEEMTGYKATDFIEGSVRTFNSVIHPEDRDRVKQLVDAALDEDRPFSLEYRVVRDDGVVRWVSEKGTGILNRSGEVTYIDGFIEDITDRVRLVDALHEREEWFRGIFEDSSIAINVYAADGSLRDANRACVEMFGVGSSSDLRGFKLFDDPNLPPEAHEALRAGEALQYVSEFDFAKVRERGLYETKREGVIYLDTVVSPLKLGEDDSVDGYIVQMKDITERKQAEDRVKESEELFRSTIESTADGVLVVSVAGDVLHFNQKFGEMWRIPGYVLQKRDAVLLRRYVLDQLEDPGTFMENLEEAYRTDEEVHDQLAFKDGRVLQRSSVPIVKNGEPIARVWTFTDITNIKRAEETARLYLDLMGHDIRNHLQGVALSVEILGALYRDDRCHEVLEDIERVVSRCALLIQKVKETENLQEASLYERDLGTVVREQATEQAKIYTGTDIEVTASENRAIVLADCYLEVLVANLLENAVQHNPREDKKVWVSLGVEDRGHVLTVTDNGPGIDDRRKEELFDRQRRYGGVGLHQVLHIAEKYGGHVKARDRVPGEPFQGATFQVWLPELDREDSSGQMGRIVGPT